MTTAQLRKIGMQGAVFERDSTFGLVQPQTSPEEPKARETPIAINVDLLKVRCFESSFI